MEIIWLSYADKFGGGCLKIVGMCLETVIIEETYLQWRAGYGRINAFLTKIWCEERKKCCLIHLAFWYFSQ